MSKELTAMEKTILNIEKRRFKYPGAKEWHILSVTGMKPIQYYQALNKLLETERAARAEPAIVKRLLEHRDS